MELGVCVCEGRTYGVGRVCVYGVGRVCVRDGRMELGVCV